jgi:hypothetical protein
LIDLFAWLSDTILYRANLIPERQRLAFLRLLGAGMHPAVPACGLLQLLIDDAAAVASVELPLHTSVTTPLFPAGARPASRDVVAEGIDKCRWFALPAAT